MNIGPPNDISYMNQVSFVKGTQVGKNEPVKNWNLLTSIAAAVEITVE